MRTTDLHRDVGAYALGVLDAASAFRFEDHLMDCPRCALQLSEFTGVKAQLDRYSRRTPPEVAPFTTVSPELLHRMVEGTVALGRRSRRRRLALVAAAAVLAVGGPLAVLGSASEPGAGPGLRWTASAPSGVTTAVITAVGTDWGTDVGLKLNPSGLSGASGVCTLVAVTGDGSRETVMSWTAPAPYAAPVIAQGGAALRPEQINHFEVLTADGRRLVTVNR